MQAGRYRAGIAVRGEESRARRAVRSGSGGTALPAGRTGALGRS